MDLTAISTAALCLLLLIILFLASQDYRRRRRLTTRPGVSFIIPCYNDGDTVEASVRSILASYEESRCEIIVADDCSTDGSNATLRRLQRALGFRLVENPKNSGKARTLNKVYRLAKHDILFFMDADVRLNPRALKDILARLEQPGVAAVSAPYTPRNKGFLPSMQAVEYTMLTLMQVAYNSFATTSLWGGCFAIRRDAFERAGRFSENAISEDMDLALKLAERGYRVEQTFHAVESHVPDTARAWFSQKIRWTSGSTQAMIRHFGIWVRHPLHWLFVPLYSALSIIFVVNVVRQVTLLENIFLTRDLIFSGITSLATLRPTAFSYGGILLRNLLFTVAFSAFSLPYAIPLMRGIRDWRKPLLAIPYAAIYYPAFSVVFVLGLIVGVARYPALRKGVRAW